MEQRLASTRRRMPAGMRILKQRRRSKLGIKTFHLIFISISVLLAGGVAVWAFDFAQQVSRPAVYVATGIGAILFGLGLVVYEIVFVRKLKDLD